MTSRIRARKDVDEEQTTSQREQNAEKFENRENTSRSDDEDVATSSNDNVDYIELAAKKRKKTKNLKVKREYFILQERNRRLREFLRNDEVETQSTRCRRTIEIDEDLLTEVSELKRQRLIIDLKSANLNIYHDKSFKKFKN